MSGIPVVPLRGEYDIANAALLRRELLAAAGNHDLGLVVDMTGTTYLDSAAVNVLFELAEALRDRQLELALVVPEGGLVDRVVSLVDLGSVTRLHRDLDTAVAEIREAGGPPESQAG
jgi:anti-sigma B factor antagonist